MIGRIVCASLKFVGVIVGLFAGIMVLGFIGDNYTHHVAWAVELVAVLAILLVVGIGAFIFMACWESCK